MSNKISLSHDPVKRTVPPRTVPSEMGTKSHTTETSNDPPYTRLSVPSLSKESPLPSFEVGTVPSLQIRF